LEFAGNFQKFREGEFGEGLEGWRMKFDDFLARFEARFSFRRNFVNLLSEGLIQDLKALLQDLKAQKLLSKKVNRRSHPILKTQKL
jgi:hypothetical protein